MKMKKSSSKLLGEITGKVIASAVALPGKTSSTTSSIKSEFIAGFNSTNAPRKVKGDSSPENTQL